MEAGPMKAKEFTPIKEVEGRAVWTDYRLLQLLRHYIQKAEDPFERPPAHQPKGKAAFKRNAPKDGDMYQNSYIYLENGDKVELKEFTSHDNVCVQLGQAKLSGQTGKQGLVSIIDEYFEVEQPHLAKTKAELLELKEEVMALAESYSSN